VWLWREFKIKSAHVIDTQLKAESLHSLFTKYIPWPVITLEQKKAMQTSDWAKRPLSEEQLDYSCLDTYYLHFIAS
jgi:ribonuclease D